MQIINWNNYSLSKLCLGTVQFGLDYGIANNLGQVSQEEANNILKFTLTSGINCLDTAKAYGNSENIIGEFIQDTHLENVNIISKIKSDIFYLSHNEAIADIQLSLNNLSCESLFGMLLHDNKILYNWDIKESHFIKTLKELNLIRQFGVSIYTDEEFNLALNNTDIDIIQIPFNLFDQRAISKEWLKKAKAKNKLIFIRSVYLQGLILMDIGNVPLHLNDARKYIKVIDMLCKKLDITKNELALSFVNSVAKDSVVLFGCDSLDQAKENIKTFNNLIKLDSDTLGYIKKNLSEVGENIYNPSKWSKK